LPEAWNQRLNHFLEWRSVTAVSAPFLANHGGHRPPLQHFSANRLAAAKSKFKAIVARR
jgi:hypothetical protein